MARPVTLAARASVTTLCAPSSAGAEHQRHQATETGRYPHARSGDLSRFSSTRIAFFLAFGIHGALQLVARDEALDGAAVKV